MKTAGLIRWLNNLRVFFKNEINEESDNETVDEIIKRLQKYDRVLKIFSEIYELRR